MKVLKKIGYAIEAFLCRHSDQISKAACLIAAAFFMAVVAISLCLAVFFFRELMTAENTFATIFLGAWGITCALVAPIACVVIARKCYKISQTFGWHNLAY